MKRVLIIAGESSGDMHGAALMRSMKNIDPGIEFAGIGGSRMIAEGLTALRQVHQMNFMGLVEVIKHLPFIFRTMQDLNRYLDTWKPDLAILIDYPGFNLKFAPRVKERGIPVMYYISPQLWAWHRGRVGLIRRFVDRMVVLFEFEREFYRHYDIDAEFVGHPLLDSVKPSMSRDEFRHSLGLDGSSKLVGLLPGSRPQEIDRILPVMIESVRRLSVKEPDIAVVLGCAPDIDDAYYNRYIDGTRIIMVRDRAYDVMAHSDALAVTSGTATLEAGILATPMVIVYRTSILTYLIGRTLVHVDNIGMINIVAGSRIVPELWQGEVNPANLTALVKTLLRDDRLREQIAVNLHAARKKLGSPGASDRAAAVALDLLGASEAPSAHAPA